MVSGKTSNESKRKYNQKAYATHLYVYRRNSEFAERIAEFKAKKGTSFNYLITQLLAKHWDVPVPVPEMDN
jgi:predicted amidophosphoribosyltransferase